MNLIQIFPSHTSTWESRLSEMHQLATAKISLKRAFNSPVLENLAWVRFFSLKRVFIISDLQNSCFWLKNLKNQVLTYPIHSEYQKNIY